MELLKSLCEAPGLPGSEEPVKKIISKTFSEFTDEITEDALGNIIAHIPGKGPRLVVDAHTDEVGFMVNHIDEKGFLRVTPLGGIDPRVFYAQRITVWGKRPLTGIVAAIPPHISRDTNNKEVPEVEDCVVDLGLSADKVKGLVKVGDVASFCYPFEETEDAVLSKALDDRVALFVMIEAIRKKPKLGCDLYLTATVQEEVGLRGARVIVPVYEPDFAIALEGTVAMDVPGIPDYKTLANTEKGPEIRLSDRFLVAHRPFSQFIMDTAKSKSIPYQVTVKKAGSTNATAMQVTGKGSRAAAVSVPVRYLHSPSNLAYKSDIRHTINLVFSVIENIKNFGKK
ncbi:MAG: M42 family peptidase [Deltaproteobacteria bacterium]